MPTPTEVREPDLPDLDDDRPIDPARTVTFRGSSYDAAVQAAEDALGTRPRVLSAHRIQRGGIGGFFATDLGVEVAVEVPGESIDSTIERLVEPDDSVGDTRDREAWLRELARAAGLDLDARPVAESDEQPPPAPSQPFRYAEYLSELDLGAAPVESSPPAAAPSASEESVRPAATAPTGTPTARPAPTPSTATVPTSRPTPPLASGGECTDGSTVATTQPTRSRRSTIVRRAATPPEPVTAEPAPSVSDPVAAPTRQSTVPTRHHVDLAVVAASELVRLSGAFDPGTVVDIQVTVTSNDGRSVSAEASVERPAGPTRRRGGNRS